MLKIIKLGPFSSVGDFERFSLEAPTGVLKNVSVISPENISGVGVELAITADDGDSALLNHQFNICKLETFHANEQRTVSIDAQVKKNTLIEGYAKVSANSTPASNFYVKVYLEFENN